MGKLEIRVGGEVGGMKTFLGNLLHACFGTIRSQLIIGVTLVYSVMMFLFVLHLMQNQRALILDRQVELACILADALAASTAGPVATEDHSALQEIVNGERKSNGLAFAILLDKRGKVLAHTDPAQIGSYLQDLPAPPRQTIISRNLALVDVISPVERAGRQVGWARVGVSQKIAGERRARLFRDALYHFLAAILGGSLLVWLTVKRLTKRLEVVQNTIDTVRGGDRLARIPEMGNDEVAGIAREFNSMLDAMQESDVALLSLYHRNELILNAAGEGIYGVDKEGVILFANPAAARMLGYQPEELVGRHSHLLFHHTRADGTPNPIAQCCLNKSVREGAVLRGQNEVFWTKGGRMIQVEYINTPIIEVGEVVGTVVVFRDISARKAAEEELRLSATRLAEAQRLAHLGHWELDLLRNRLFWSDEVYRIFALQPQENNPAYEIILDRVHPDDREKVDQVYGEALQKHIGYDIEYRILLPNGEIRHVQELCTTEYDASSQPLRSLGTLLDITERRQMEGQLRQAQKLESIGTLAGGIAHDFNNILTAIIGFGEIVMAQLPPDSKLRDEQAHVLKAGERARELVKQILTFSRRSEQQAKPLLPQFVVKEALKLIRASIPVSVQIREDIDVDCGAVLADPGQIHQVVMNLCTNAYQAMRETGGEMRVALGRVIVLENEAKVADNIYPGPYVCLEVADNGCGMESGVLERIFEPYFTTKSNGAGEGTGLGLAMVHGIVTSLGGGILVASKLGVGSTFTVYLPLLGGDPVSPEEEVCEEIPGGDESILVVDDEEDVVAIERLLLERLGYKVTAYPDSEQALQAFTARPLAFDLVITDMTMPRMSGAELTRMILRIRPEMPVILCTGFSELIDSEKARTLGIREFLLKPLANAALAKAVRRALADVAPTVTSAGQN